MNYRKISDTDLLISEIGLGCWTIGGRSWEKSGRPSGWKGIVEKEVIEAVAFAVDAGVNHFDNADVYGDGDAERLLAKVLGSNNKRVVISSKVGHFKGTASNAYEPLHIKHQCEQSLLNLRRDHIDIYYFHHGNFGHNDCYLEDAYDMFLRLRDEGKIRLIGLSAYTNRDFLRLIPVIQPDVVQSWANMMDYHFIADGAPLMKMCEEYNISFIAFSPLNQGILMDKYNPEDPPVFSSGDHRSRSEKFKKPYLKKAEKGLNKIKSCFGNKPEDLASVSLQFLLSFKNVVSVIPGFRNREQVEINFSAVERKLNKEEISWIRNAFR